MVDALEVFELGLNRLGTQERGFREDFQKRTLGLLTWGGRYLEGGCGGVTGYIH